jgi:hypothetical protein
LRATVAGGTLAPNGTNLVWNDHGYCELARDAPSLTFRRLSVRARF